MIVELKAAKRRKTGKAVQKLRSVGVMPAVVYGPKQETLTIEISLRDFSIALDSAGESTVINLNVDGEAYPVLIHDIDRDPVTDKPRHVDFYAIVKGQKVKVGVPIEFTGEAPAVKELSGNLVKALHELEVEADPMDLPKELFVDVSGLDALGMQILAKDVALPPGVALVTEPEEVVATVVAAKEEVEEEVAAPDIASIELSEERGKKPEEEGEKEPAKKE